MTPTAVAHIVHNGEFDQGAEDENYASANPHIGGLCVGDWRQIGVDACDGVSYLV